jgi:hypothetical protein
VASPQDDLESLGAQWDAAIEEELAISHVSTRARIEGRMAELERRHPLLRATDQRYVLQFSPMAKFMDLLAGDAVHISVVGGSNSAGAKMESSDLGWPEVLQQDIRATLPQHNVTVFNAAQGHHSNRDSYLSLQQSVSSSSGLMLWEFARNDFSVCEYQGGVRNFDHQKFGRNFKAWIAKAGSLFSRAGFGFVVLPDLAGNGCEHKGCQSSTACGTDLPEQGLAQEQVDTILRDHHHVGNTAFTAGMWHYLMKVGANKTGYDAAWNPCHQHLHAAGQKLVSALVEYAIYRGALRVADNEQQEAQPTDSKSSTAASTASGLLYELPIQTTKALSWHTPNFGSTDGGASATLQCGGTPAQHLGPLLLNGRGCIKPPPLPQDGPKCRALNGMGTNLELKSPEKCDNHRCPPCLALRALIIPPRVDTKMALMIDDDTCCSLSEDHHITISRLDFWFRRLHDIPRFVEVNITHHISTGEHATRYVKLRMCKLSCVPGVSRQKTCPYPS